MWELTIEQQRKSLVQGKKYEYPERIILKSDNHEKLLLTASSLAEAYPDQNITYKLEREEEE